MSHWKILFEIEYPYMTKSLNLQYVTINFLAQPLWTYVSFCATSTPHLIIIDQLVFQALSRSTQKMQPSKAGSRLAHWWVADIEALEGMHNMLHIHTIDGILHLPSIDTDMGDD